MSWLSDWLGPPTPKAPKPEKVIPPKPIQPPKKVMRYVPKEFDVGVTTVLVIFEDGREVHSKVYGTVDQYVEYGSFRDRDNPRVAEPYVQTSVDVYKAWLYNLKPADISKVFDDSLNPTITWAGRISHLEIHETQKYLITHNTAVIEYEDAPQEEIK